MSTEELQMDIVNRDICLNCTLSDCDEHSSSCPLNAIIYGPQKKYSKTDKAKEANRKAAAAFYKKNKEKVRGWQKRYRQERQHVKIDC